MRQASPVNMPPMRINWREDLSVVWICGLGLLPGYLQSVDPENIQNYALHSTPLLAILIFYPFEPLLCTDGWVGRLAHQAGVNKKPFACPFQDRQFQNP